MNAMWVSGHSVRPEWVHDNLLQVNGATWDSNGTARDVPWSDVQGLPRGWGATFRGRRSIVTGFGGSLTTGPFDPADPFRFSQKGYWFHFAVPTPVIAQNARSRLLRVFVLREAGPHVHVSCVHVYDGLNRIRVFGVQSPPPGSAAPQLTGARGLADLVEGRSQFTLASPPPVFWSIGISVGVAFAEDGDITFIAAGADFV